MTRMKKRDVSAVARTGSPLERLVRQGKLLVSAKFASHMGWTPQAMSKALTSNRVFCVDFQGDRYFPAFYADPTYQRSQLEAVTKVLGDLPGGAKLQFFLNPRGSLGGATPLEASQGHRCGIRRPALREHRLHKPLQQLTRFVN
jgi:hypothetical protein